MINPDPVIAFTLLMFAAAIHGFFQLSISVLTLLSGHALGRKTAHKRLVNLSGAFILGAGVMTALLVSTFAWILSTPQTGTLLPALWTICCGVLFGVGVSVWLFYFSKHRGTELWIPRSFATFLSDRAKHGQNVAESFGLGMTSVFGELLFVFAPMLVAALSLISLNPELQLLGLFCYCGLSLLPLLVVGVLISRGHKLSHIQRWRETNKRFLQFAAGFGLIALALYIYVEQVVTTTVMAPGM